MHGGAWTDPTLTIPRVHGMHGGVVHGMDGAWTDVEHTEGP